MMRRGEKRMGRGDEANSQFSSHFSNGNLNEASNPCYIQKPTASLFKFYTAILSFTLQYYNYNEHHYVFMEIFKVA